MDVRGNAAGYLALKPCASVSRINENSGNDGDRGHVSRGKRRQEAAITAAWLTVRAAHTLMNGRVVPTRPFAQQSNGT